MTSRDASLAALQVAKNDIQTEATNMATGTQNIKNVPSAYKNAPMVGRLQGALYGLPAGLLAGAASYGILSLLPGIRKKKGLKAILSLIAAMGGGYYVGKPVMQRTRDAYFESMTGVPSPWKSYKLPGQSTVIPSNVIDEYASAWDKAKNDPIGYFRENFKRNFKNEAKQRKLIPSNISDAYKSIFEEPEPPLGHIKSKVADSFTVQ